MRERLYAMVDKLAYFLLPVFMLTVVTGCAQMGETTYSGLQDEIPEGANRILLEQEEVPPADAYVDAHNFLQRKEFEIVASEETMDLEALSDLSDQEPLALAARKQISEEMALRLAINVEPSMEGTGALTITSAEYASSIPADEWHPAAWTNGQAKDAFYRSLEIMRGTAYDAADFEVGVAVTPGQYSESGLTAGN